MALRVALLCSHRAPGLRFLLREDPDRGYDYDLVCCVSSDEAGAEREDAERYGVPFLAHPIAGETETRATAHLVTDRLDDGSILCLSYPFSVSPLVRDALEWGAMDVLKAYAFAHQEWMLCSAWGPLLSEAIDRMAVRKLEPLVEEP